MRKSGRLFQDDIDGTRNRLCALVRSRCLADLDPLDLFGADLIQRKSRWRTIPIDQDDGVVRTQPPHPWCVALKRDARQPLQNISHVGIAVLIQLLAPVNLLGHLRAPAQFGIVSLAALDDDPLQARPLRLRPRRIGATTPPSVLSKRHCRRSSKQDERGRDRIEVRLETVLLHGRCSVVPCEDISGPGVT